MSIDIEKYLCNSNDKLDVERPDDERIWEGIKNDMHKSGIHWTQRMIRVAAAIIVIMGVGLALRYIFVPQPAQQANLYTIDKMLGEQEMKYIQQVNYKMAEVDKIPLAENSVMADLMQELLALDTIYQESFNDLEQYGYKERIVNIMFDTYEKRIRILELIIIESQKTKDYETKSNKDIML